MVVTENRNELWAQTEPSGWSKSQEKFALSTSMKLSLLSTRRLPIVRTAIEVLSNPSITNVLLFQLNDHLIILRVAIHRVVASERGHKEEEEEVGGRQGRSLESTSCSSPRTTSYVQSEGMQRGWKEKEGLKGESGDIMVGGGTYTGTMLIMDIP